MAEIKSTLDIVLERTKNLTLTDEEKATIHYRELEGRIRGWVKKYLDGLMDLKTVKTEMAATSKNLRKAGRDILKNHILEHLAARGDALKILDLLEGIFGESRAPYIDAVEKFQKSLTVERSRFLEVLKTELAERGISGGAVMPNLDRDAAWESFHEKALAEFRTGLSLIGRDS